MGDDVTHVIGDEMCFEMGVVWAFEVGWWMVWMVFVDTIVTKLIAC